MVSWNLGSFASQITNIVENIPSSISGTPLFNIVNQQVNFVEDYTGLSIGSVAIADRFQPVILNLSISELLHYMSITGVDAASISLGDFSISKGQGGNLSDSSNAFRERAMQQLRELGFRFSNYQCL